MDFTEEQIEFLIKLASEGIIKFQSSKEYRIILEYCIKYEDKKVRYVIPKAVCYPDVGIGYYDGDLIDLYLLIRKTSLEFREFISPLLDFQYWPYEDLKALVLFDKPCKNKWIDIIGFKFNCGHDEYYEILIKVTQTVNLPNIKKELLNDISAVEYLRNKGRLHEFRDHYMYIYEVHGTETPVEVLEELFKPPDGELHLLGQKKLEEYHELHG